MPHAKNMLYCGMSYASLKRIVQEGTKKKKHVVKKKGHCLSCRCVVEHYKHQYPICRDCRNAYFFRAGGKPLEGREVSREMARCRDHHRCKECDVKWVPGKRRFDCHHINGLCGELSRKYDKDISVLITLCHRCHLNRHDRSAGITKNIKRLKGKKEEMEELRTLGKTYDEIGEKFGASGAAVWYSLNGR